MAAGYTLAVWLLAQVLLIVGYPIIQKLFPDTETDVGTFLCIPAISLVLFFLCYWIGQWTYGLSTVLTAFLVVLMAVGVLTYSDDDISLFPSPKQYFEVMGVFTAAFLFMVFLASLRFAVLPGGGEKFLDMGLLTSLLRTNALPPEDFWFAGKPTAYYYGGQLMGSIYLFLSGVPARHGFSILVAFFYAIEVTAVYGLSGGVARKLGHSKRIGSVCGALLFGLASNLYQPVLILSRLTPFDLQAIYTHPTINLSSPSALGYWHATRILETTIAEFPLFAFFNGDLHAHMISVPFLLAAIGALYAYSETSPDALRHRQAIVYLALPLCGGGLLLSNAWGYASVAGATVVVLSLAETSPVPLVTGLFPEQARSRVESVIEGTTVGRYLSALVVGAWVFGIGLLTVAPFLMQAIGQTSSYLGITWLPSFGGVVGHLLAHGAFLGVFWAYITGRLKLNAWGVLAVGTGLALVIAAAALFIAGGVILFLPLVLAAWYVARREGGDFESALILSGAGLVLVTTIVAVRMSRYSGTNNMAFKALFQVWVFWAIAAGGILPGFFDRVETWVPTVTPRGRQFLGGIAVIGLLLMLCVPYTGIAVLDAAQSPGATDGYAGLEKEDPGGKKAVQWINENIEGQPNMATAPAGGEYVWANYVSVFTGVPTVVGWTHEQLYRGNEAYQSRVEDMEMLYSTDDASVKREILDKYNIQYVYAGQVERGRYGDVGFSGLQGVSPVYQKSGVTIYRIPASIWR